MSADGNESGEKIINKEDSEKSMRQILGEKLDTKGDKKKSTETVDRLMGKYFPDQWVYQDAASEGFIETSRAQQMVHKIIGAIKLDDEEEGLMWKS